MLLPRTTSGGGGVTPIIPPHNQLQGLQGGGGDSRYHLDEWMFQLLNSGILDKIPQLEDLVNEMSSMLSSAVLKLLNGTEMLPPVNNVSELPDPCVKGQIVFVRSEYRFYKCEEDHWDVADKLPDVNDETDLPLTCSPKEIIYVTTSDKYYLCVDGQWVEVTRLPDANDVDELPDTCNEYEIIYVVVLDEWYICSEGGWGPVTPPAPPITPPTNEVDDFYQLSVPCNSGEIWLVKNENQYYQCRGDGSGWDVYPPVPQNQVTISPGINLNGIDNVESINGVPLPLALVGGEGVYINCNRWSYGKDGITPEEDDYMWVPDYANMESVNRTPSTSDVWIADRNGYVHLSINSGGFYIDSQMVIHTTTGVSGVFPVAVGMNIHPLGSSSTPICNFIPAKKVTMP